MVIVTLMGGLGNQMFQYAFGKSLSLLRNTSLKLDTSVLMDKTLNHTIRKFELGIFDLKATIATEQDLNLFREIQNSRVKRAVRKIVPALMPYFLINEPGPLFNSSMLQFPKNTWAKGFWQTEKYFSKIGEVIRKDFSFPSITDEANKLLSATIASCNSVSIHVRRGDYVSNPETNKFHGTCGLEYYKTAIKYISEKVPESEFYVFSDDLVWVQQNIFSERPITYISHNKGDKAYLDMRLMSLCKHNIIANSSFSWWAAWLNAYKGKIVVAPQRWFNDASVNTSDVIPESWTKL